MNPYQCTLKIVEVFDPRGAHGGNTSLRKVVEDLVRTSVDDAVKKERARCRAEATCAVSDALRNPDH